MKQADPEKKKLEQEQDKIWIGLVANGGMAAEKAFKALHSRYCRKLVNNLRRHGLAEEICEDLVQESFMKVWTTADSYDGRANVETWLKAIVRNCMIDHFRKANSREASQHQSLNIDDDDGNLEAEWDIADEHADGRLMDWKLCMYTGLERFTKSHPDRATAVELRSRGLEYEEIAQMINRTAKATREYLSQCRKILDQFIGECRELLATY